MNTLTSFDSSEHLYMCFQMNSCMYFHCTPEKKQVSTSVLESYCMSLHHSLQMFCLCCTALYNLLKAAASLKVCLSAHVAAVCRCCPLTEKSALEARERSFLIPSPAQAPLSACCAPQVLYDHIN